MTLYLYKNRVYRNIYPVLFVQQTTNEITQQQRLFVKNLATDFTRKCKLGFEELLKILLMMEGGSLKKELPDFLHYALETASVSAFN